MNALPLALAMGALILVPLTAQDEKKLMEMPKIFGAAMQLGQKHAEKYAPQFQAQLEKILKKYQDGVDPEKKDK
ncbi:MAG: hypothetical protein VCA37_17815 [Roseibacillus sp.]|jgi:hypothetical protein